MTVGQKDVIYSLKTDNIFHPLIKIVSLQHVFIEGMYGATFCSVTLNPTKSVVSFSEHLDFIPHRFINESVIKKVTYSMKEGEIICRLIKQTVLPMYIYKEL
jgi:hypothetical protein